MKQKKYNLEFYSPKLLVSFKNLYEISNEVLDEIDILDLKNPEKGSIGSWSKQGIRKATSKFGRKKKISATLGDIMDTQNLLKRLNDFDKLDLCFIKFGLFSFGNANLLERIKLIGEKKYHTELVCVIFVDDKRTVSFTLKNLEFFKIFGIKYLLLDTFKKNDKDLLSFCNEPFLRKFINECKGYKIRVGLAGKIKEKQIPFLINLKPDIIGLRSAVCEKYQRNSTIEIGKLKKISSYFSFSKSRANERAGA